MFHISNCLNILIHTLDTQINCIFNNLIHNLYNIYSFRTFLLDIRYNKSFYIRLFDNLICKFIHLILVMDHMFVHTSYLPCLPILNHKFLYIYYHLNNNHFCNLYIEYLNCHNKLNK